MGTDQPELEADKSEREFLHDLSNPLAIAYGNLKILATKLDADQNSIPMEMIVSKLTKAVNSFERANALLDKRRIFIRSNSEVA